MPDTPQIGSPAHDPGHLHGNYGPEARRAVEAAQRALDVADAVWLPFDVDCAPPYDNAEMTALISTRVICDTLGRFVRSGHLPKRKG